MTRNALKISATALATFLFMPSDAGAMFNSSMPSHHGSAAIIPGLDGFIEVIFLIDEMEETEKSRETIVNAADRIDWSKMNRQSEEYLERKIRERKNAECLKKCIDCIRRNESEISKITKGANMDQAGEEALIININIDVKYLTHSQAKRIEPQICKLRDFCRKGGRPELSTTPSPNLIRSQAETLTPDHKKMMQIMQWLNEVERRGLINTLH